MAQIALAHTPRPAGARRLRPRVTNRLSLLATAVVAVGIGAYALLFGWLALEEYWAYEMHALDMGNMGQAAWNTLHGHPFYFTNMRLPYAIEAWGTTTRLSFHVEAIFPIISLVYVLYPHAESLLVLQTAALALGAIPTYVLARDILGNRWLAPIFALAYLVYPSVEAMNLYEFHPVALATPLLIAAFLFMWRRHWIPFAICGLAAMGTKEEIGLTVAMFGLYAALVLRQRKIGLSVAALGVAWPLFATLVVEHHFRQPGTITYLHSRYGYLGHGPSGFVHTVVHNPGVFGTVLFAWPKLGYLVRLFAPLGFLALLDPLTLALALPTFVLNLFSQDFHMYSGVGDNSAELLAIIVISSIFGAGRVIRLLQPRFRARTAVLLVGIWVSGLALWNQRASGFTPLGAMWHVPKVTAHQRIADRFVAMVPSGVPVSTQDQLDPHLSSRHYLYLFEDTGRPPDPPLAPSDYILLDVTAPTYPLLSFELHDYAQSWIRRRGWGIAAADDGLILLKKGAASRHLPRSFYTFALAGSATGANRLTASQSGVQILGYDRERLDLSSHYVPNLGYTFYLRPSRSLRADLQPVVFEVEGQTLLTCAAAPLGLAWLPSNRWKPGTTYRVRMNPMETNASTPGTASLSMELVPVPRGRPDCGRLWASHGKLVPVGTLDVQF